MEGGEKGGMDGGEKGGMDGEGWRGHGVVWSEGGRGSRAHSPELVVARVLIIAHVLFVTPVLTVARVLVVACVRPWALAVIRETRWPSWLVVGRVRRGSWAMKGARRRLWAVEGGGDRSRAVGGRRGCERLVMVVGGGSVVLRSLWPSGCGRSLSYIGVHRSLPRVPCFLCGKRRGGGRGPVTHLYRVR